MNSVHLRIYPYKCDHCDKGFSNRDNLNGHSFVHTGEMAYLCSSCSEKFQWKKQLEIHTKKMHMGGNCVDEQCNT